MSYVRELVLLALLVLPTGSASANTLTRPADFEALHKVLMSALTLGKDLWSTAGTQGDLKCVSYLNDRIKALTDVLGPLDTMVMLASDMVDSTDEQKIIRLLSHQAPDFLKSVEADQRGTNAVMAECAGDALTAVKAQELLHILDRAAGLVKALIKKIGPPQR
jgi:hypothetical protein